MNVLNKVGPKDAKSEAFIEAYDRYADSIYRFALFKVNNKDTAWDIVQECFLKTWRHAQEDRIPIKNYKAMLYAIAKNLVIDHWRKKDKNSTTDLEEVAFTLSDDSNLFEQTANKEEIKIALQMLDKIPEQQKEILILRYVDDLAFSEIAKMTGKSIVAARVETYRAIKKLKQIMSLKNG